MRHRGEEDDQDVEEALLRGRGPRPIVVVAATSTPDRLEVVGGRPCPTRSCVAVRRPARPMTISTTDAGPTSRVACSSGAGVRVQEGPLGGRLDDPDQRPGRVLAVDPQRDRVADPEVGLVLADVRRGDERVAVGSGTSQRPSCSVGDGPSRVGRQPERDERSGSPSRRPRIRWTVAKRHGSAAVDARARRAASVSSSSARAGPAQLHLDVVVEVGERVVEGLVERRADREDGHEDRAAQAERGERQGEARPCGGTCCGSRAGWGAGGRGSRWIARSSRLRPKRSAMPGAASASRTVTRTPRQTGTRAASERHQQADRDLQGEDLRRARRRSSTSKLARPAVKTVKRVGAEGPERAAPRRARGRRRPAPSRGRGPAIWSVARADGLHDPDLARLLGDDRVDRVDDQEARGEQGQEAHEAEDEEEALAAGRWPGARPGGGT